jgi:HSP20 family protein
MSALMTSPVLHSLRREMDRFMDRVWDGHQEAFLAEWRTPADVFDTAEAVVVQLEVPGIDPRDIRLTLKDQTLVVHGEKKRDMDTKEVHFLQMERGYGAVSRAITLPTPVDATKVTATFRNGVVTVKLEKAAESRGTTIPIQAP